MGLGDEHLRTDEAFDCIYPPPIERLSRPQWTPVTVAKRAAALLASGVGQSILDVGAGVGKFCVVGAVTTEARFVGVEKRDYLVNVGQAVIDRHQIERVELVRGDALSIDWSGFDGIYIFNPFGGDERSIRRAEEKLWELRPGARVVTYHGFGGLVPDVYRRLASDGDRVEVWQRRPARAMRLGR
jgi:hypothetical protein